MDLNPLVKVSIGAGVPVFVSPAEAATLQRAQREERRTLERRRHLRHYRRCEPLDHTPPWVKYARRGVPS